MIVRISGEGQFDVADDSVDSLNQYDAKLEAALAGLPFSRAGEVVDGAELVIAGIGGGAALRIGGELAVEGKYASLKPSTAG